MGRARSLKQATKKKLSPVISVGIRMLHLRVGGKQIFANKYARRVPGISHALKMVDSRLRSARTAEERKIDYQKWFKQNYLTKKELTKHRGPNL
jgi:hypothetical protein